MLKPAGSSTMGASIPGCPCSYRGVALFLAASIPIGASIPGCPCSCANEHWKLKLTISSGHPHSVTSPKMQLLLMATEPRAEAAAPQGMFNGAFFLDTEKALKIHQVPVHTCAAQPPPKRCNYFCLFSPPPS
eukprot:1156100-Pelagomonas_calceolata.AAC.3